MATPSRNRQKVIYSDLPRLPRSNAAGTSPFELEEIPPSSISRIPSSTAKVRGSVKDGIRNNDEHFLPNIEQTPTRGPSKLTGRPKSSHAVMKSSSNSTQLPSFAATRSTPLIFSTKSDLSSLPSDAKETPSKAHYNVDDLYNQESHTGPTEGLLSANWGTDDTQRKCLPPPSEDEGTSIYATLGWDDDIDEL